MPDATTNLQLPYILASQAQKHVSHNEALRLLDGLVQLSVRDRDLTAPPGSPADGDRYIVGSGATGDWAGWDLNVALWSDGVWQKLTPREGWRAWIEDEGVLLAWDGAAWSSILPDELQNLSFLGVNGTADANNRLLVQSPGSLLNHEGGGHQLKINKASAGETASLLFQTAWGGRAEMGTAGSDDWSIKVSADGGSWNEALRADAATGALTAPQGLTVAPNAGLFHEAGISRLKQPYEWLPLGISHSDVSAGWSDPYPAYGGGLPVNHQANRCFQWLVDGQTADFWVRANHVNNPEADEYWTPFYKIVKMNDILGAVSQSGGTPTGAIFERGSNGNGSYTRFADGTQICAHELEVDPPNTASGGVFQGAAPTTWIFPAGFASGTLPTVSATDTNIGGLWSANYVGRTGAASIRAQFGTSKNAVPVMAVLAVGRWF